MKCIKVIKATKDHEVGTIRRVDDREADSKVSTGYWMFIPKSEWKLSTRKSKSTTDQATEQVTDQVEKKPYKKGQKSEKHKNKE